MNCWGRNKIILYFEIFTSKNHATILLTLKYTHIKNWKTVQKQLFIKISENTAQLLVAGNRNITRNI